MAQWIRPSCSLNYMIMWLLLCIILRRECYGYMSACEFSLDWGAVFTLSRACILMWAICIKTLTKLGAGLDWSSRVGPGAWSAQVIARLSQGSTHPANEPPHHCLQEMQDKGEGTGSVGWGGDREYRSLRLPCDINNKVRCGTVRKARLPQRCCCCHRSQLSPCLSDIAAKAHPLFDWNNIYNVSCKKNCRYPSIICA